jgi:predicted dehydrogenase/nucleoside-diphosphate-sugar epimerase
MTAAPRFRLAVIGAGEAAGTLHLPAALASELVEVVALIDPVVERAEALAARYGIRPQIGKSIDDIPNPVDGAIIATPNNTHRDAALACAARRISCLIEKPLATTLCDAEEICRAAAEHGIVLAVGYAMRFRNEVTLLKRLLENRFFGDISRFHFQHGSLGGWSPVSGYNLDRKASGGGVLVVSGTHFLDLMLYWFGYPDECEMLDDAVGGPEAHCVVTVRYRSAGRQFDGTVRLSKVFDLNPGFVIDAEKGRVLLGVDTSRLLFRPREDGPFQIVIEPRGQVDFPRGISNFQLQLEDFVGACHGKRSPLVDGRQGLLSVRLLDQLYSTRKCIKEPGLLNAHPQRPCRLSGKGNTVESMKVAVFGASGFVGSTLVEQLKQKGIEVVAAIHSTGNAWRLARYGVWLRSVDLMARGSIADALRGCTHVVNCTRGSDDLMIRGLKNLLAEAARQRVRRFVHLSSVAVYGDPPPAESVREECEPRPEPGTYGAIKLHQDELVASAHAAGLNSAVLCPPNITGLYSPFLCSVLDDMRCGRLALIDDGRMPINLVDVENLCHAIELALRSDRADGRRTFVTDRDGITWKDLTDELMPLAELPAPLPSLPLSTIAVPRSAAERRSPLRAMKHLVSSEVRSALRADPLFAKMELAARGLIKKLPGRFEDRLRRRIGGPQRVSKAPTSRSFRSRYIGQQLRGVIHSSERAVRLFGYVRIIEFPESMERFRRWYIATRGMESESWPLARDLLQGE